jgi:hypothetical protein
MVLVNVVVFAVSGSLGLIFLLQTLQRLSMATPISPPAPDVEGLAGDAPRVDPVLGALDPLEGQVLGRHVKVVFRCWVVLFGLVGAQMGWVLRPFIGDPSMPFVWIRARDANFFQGVMHALTRVFS